jgi:hypothetical protein
MKYLLVLMLVACHDTYRYPCQNPDNWGKAECEPPQCEASGTCTKDLIPKDMYDAWKKKS